MRTVLLLLALTAEAILATPILSFNTAGASSGTENNQSVGWSFTVLSPITVTGLGWYDQNGDGLSLAHMVGIWDTVGTLLTSATVALGTVNPLDGLFRTVAISPIVLAPGAGYIVGGQNFTTSTDQLAFGVVPATVASITFTGGVFSAVNGIFERPTSPTGAGGGNANCCWGPSFSISVAPEPSSITLVALPFLLWLGLGTTRRIRTRLKRQRSSK
jgi:hypothetical protein